MKCLSVFFSMSLALFAFGFSCSSAKKTDTESRTATDKHVDAVSDVGVTVLSDTFVLPPIPEMITVSSERAAYLVMHYWDNFDFTNRKLIGKREITEQAFVDYINILYDVTGEQADASLHYTLERASQDTVMYAHFGMLFEKYLYDPNSPFRNEEFYIPVLQDFSHSPLLSKEHQSNYMFQLDMVLKNRIGQKANNFMYTLETGDTYTLYDLKSEYTLLIFSNPSCGMCEAVAERLSISDELKQVLSLNTARRTMLTVLTVYPDMGLREWPSYIDDMPSSWIHAFDKDEKIIDDKLYDIRAYPTIYLLDSHKKVVLKDTSIDAVELFFDVSD